MVTKHLAHLPACYNALPHCSHVVGPSKTATCVSSARSNSHAPSKILRTRRRAGRRPPLTQRELGPGVFLIFTSPSHGFITASLTGVANYFCEAFVRI